jgi:hypothetical protein
MHHLGGPGGWGGGLPQNLAKLGRCTWVKNPRVLQFYITSFQKIKYPGPWPYDQVHVGGATV